MDRDWECNNLFENQIQFYFSGAMQKKMQKLTHSMGFSLFINVIIIINAILIGVETFHITPLILGLQKTILLFFALEIILRYVGKESIKEYFSNGWNLFDIFIVTISFIPESLFHNSEALSVFRVMRIFRIIRLAKTLPELRIIVSVLLKSMKSLGYTLLLLNIFMYMYAIMGVVLFKGGPMASDAPASPDPYGSISEAFFTLFRISTGEDWTDLRYNLLGSGEDWLVTTYHVSWMGISAFLLINLVVGAVVNNYDQVMSEYQDTGKKKDLNPPGEHNREDMAQMNQKLDSLQKQIENLTLALAEKKA